MTGAVNKGNLSSFPAYGSPAPGSPIKHRWCHVVRAWCAQQREAQAKPLRDGQNCRSSLSFAFTLPMTTHFRKAEHSPFQMSRSLRSLLCPSEILWLIVVSWRASLSPQPMYTAATAKQISSYSLMTAFLHPLHLYSSYRGVVATGAFLRQGISEALGSIAASHLKALPQSSRLGLLIFVSAFLSGSNMGRKERFSGGDKELCFHLHHVCTAEVNTDPCWFCWRRELCQGYNWLAVWGPQSSMSEIGDHCTACPCHCPWICSNRHLLCTKLSPGGVCGSSFGKNHTHPRKAAWAVLLQKGDKP